MNLGLFMIVVPFITFVDAMPKMQKSQGICGKRYFEDYYSSRSAHIVGGREANRGSLPWQASIQYPDGTNYCGGTVIGTRWILTAAHCFKNSITWGTDRIIMGEHKLKMNEGSEQSIQIASVYIHPAYEPYNFQNDIALLKLKEDIVYDSYTQPACIPKKANEQRDYAPGDMVTVSGWGTLRSGGETPTTLQVVQVPFISDQTCNKPENYGGEILSSMVCAGELSGGKDSCQGDSGGPLVKKIDGKWTVLGVVSWGRGCALGNKPGVYTRVAEFEKWIHDTMQ